MRQNARSPLRSAARERERDGPRVVTCRMGDLKATYRLQLRPHLDFAAARSQVPYLTRLGISHLYLSPLSGWIREARNVSIA